LAGNIAFAQVKYKVTDVGPFQPLRISQTGMAAGGRPGYAWDSENGLTQIPGFGYPGGVFAYDVSSPGQVVGYSIGYDNFEHAYVWDRVGGTRRFADFGKYSNGWDMQSRAYGTNDLGQIVGVWDKEGGLSYEAGFLYTPGQGWVDLPRLYADRGVQALQVNNAGQIIGYSSDDHYGTPIMWNPDGTIVELGHLLNQRQNFLGDINENGYICGFTYGPLGNVGYVRSPDGTYTPIYSPHNPRGWMNVSGLNNHQQAAATYFRDQEFVGALWSEDTGTLTLNDWIDTAYSGWNITQANSINDAGMIVGQGRYKGGPYRGILLTPVPEPTTFLALIPPTLLLMRRHSTRLRK